MELRRLRENILSEARAKEYLATVEFKSRNDDAHKVIKIEYDNEDIGPRLLPWILAKAMDKAGVTKQLGISSLEKRVKNDFRRFDGDATSSLLYMANDAGLRVRVNLNF